MEERKLQSMDHSPLKKHNYKASRRNVLNEDSVREDDADERDEKVEAGKKFIDFFGRLIPFLYGLFAVGILGMWITGFVQRSMQDVMIWAILGTSLISSLLGAWAVYKYGVIQDQIDRLKVENQKYEHEISELQSTRIKLGNEVNELQTTVHDLEHDAKELDEETKEFEGLVEELRNIAGDNADILALLDNTNKIFNDMRKVVLENERAHLLSTFYECAFRDEDNRMDKEEYERFLGRLSKRQREKFRQLGTFEQLAGEDQHIDLGEFQEMLERVLTEVDELLKQEFAKQ
eukprot:CAMPEP_0202701110 /NCGR_PEP_ID=MMETSP1385-20130828/14216_1 /ASSEMBLY_ACC=CAM_ASM_000861 /TAXON_ID=933848 /ORGANISM="Elphidium margaritaceum" /LENGTH=289 /DNA_ID=CAMNT_0049358449 /DNA_START=84 /DNA_END=956 /DNA_ORIENTATION=-